MSSSSFFLDEAAARRVLMVQAFETGPATGKPWTAEDRALVTRLARETTPADATPERYLDERARHAVRRGTEACLGALQNFDTATASYLVVKGDYEFGQATYDEFARAYTTALMAYYIAANACK